MLACGRIRVGRAASGWHHQLMPLFERDDVAIHYFEREAPESEAGGERGLPILLFAPGGMRSAAGFWKSSPWNPVDELGDRHRVIAMDQRNAGRSRAPVGGSDGWQSYTADHIALLDHLGVERCHVIGGCIGGPFCLGLMQAAPGRVASAVLQQTIGASNNRQAFYDMFDSWADEIAQDHPEASEEVWRGFRSRMYDGEFAFSVDRDFVRGCEIPMLVLMGDDLYHPQVTSREVAALAPNAELVERWKDEDVLGETVARVRSFLAAHDR
jgi:pimeloyl-ACP methyl ester carboxylesterase